MTHHRAIALVFAVHGAVSGSLITCIPWFQQHFHLSPATLGLLLLCQPVGAFLAMPMAGRIAHHLGGRTATRLLILLWCVWLPVPALAPAPGWLFLAFLVYGMIAGTSDVLMNAHGVALERRLGRSIIAGLHGRWSVGSLAAGGAGILAVGCGLDARDHLLAVTALLLVLAAVAGRALAPDEPARADAPAPRRFALPTRAILAVGLVGFCATFAEGASSNWAAIYTTKVAAAGPSTATAAYTVFMLCMAATRLVGDRVVGRFGPVAMVRGGGVTAACGGLLVVLARTPWLCIAGFALVALGIAVIVPLVFSAAGNSGGATGDGVAGVATITYLSGLIAPAAMGWVAGAVSYPAAFAMVVLVGVAMAVLAGTLRRGGSPGAGPRRDIRPQRRSAVPADPGTPFQNPFLNPVLGPLPAPFPTPPTTAAGRAATQPNRAAELGSC